MMIALVFLLSIAVALLAIAVLALTRQIRMLKARAIPGDAPSPMSEAPVEPDAAVVATSGSRGRLLLFVAPDCAVSRAITPVAASLAHRAELDFVLLDTLAPAEIRTFGRDVPDGERPFAVVIQPDGTVRSKGPLGSREQLVRLLAPVPPAITQPPARAA